MEYYDGPPEHADLSRLSPSQRELLKSIPEYERAHVAKFLCKQQYITENAAYHKYAFASRMLATGRC